MSLPFGKGIVVCRDPALIDYFKNQLDCIHYDSPTQLQRHISDRTIIVESDLDVAYWMRKKFYDSFGGKGLLTGRVLPGVTVPLQQLPNTIILPWCSEIAFANWIALLLDIPDTLVHPEWLFIRNIQSDPRKKAHNLITILQDLPNWKLYQIKSANIAEAVGCSRRYFEKVFSELFGVKPGRLFRGWRNFAVTANLMRKEKALQYTSRRGISPLAGIETDYRRTLQKLLGITYTELREAAIREHWAVVWMRNWRKKLVNKMAVKESTCDYKANTVQI